MILKLPAPMAEYLKSIFLPTFNVFEWEQSRLTPWFDMHASSLIVFNDIGNPPVPFDLIHVSYDDSPDYRRVRLSTSHIRDYGWLLLTLPLTEARWCEIEQYLANWTCVYVVPMLEEDHNNVVLLRKPGIWTFTRQERKL